MATSDYLKRYLEPAGSSVSSDYIEPPKAKKKKKKSATKGEAGPAVKKVGGVKLVDIDSENTVLAPRNDDMDAEEERPAVEDSMYLKEQATLERKRKIREELGENVGWRELGDVRRGEADLDLSPPRRRQDDLSPPRRRRDDDLSPPRRPTGGEDLSPPRGRPASPGDLSPPRRATRPADDDLSPPRRSTRDVDLSPPRRPAQSREDDLSPPRRSGPSKRPRDDDMSPPRRPSGPADDDLSPPRSKRPKLAEEAPVAVPPGRLTQMSTGERAGLTTGADIVAEANERRKRDAERLKTMDPSAMGKGAATVYRDRRGRKLEMLNQMMRQQQGIYGDDEEENMEWGRGYVSKEERERENRRKQSDPTKGYEGQTIDNEDLNEDMRSKDRWDDPMAMLVDKKKHKKDKQKKDKKPRWTGYFPPNRFNIPPGHRWDGVDRSNGFEKEFFSAQTQKDVQKVEAYKWSVEDM